MASSTVVAFPDPVDWLNYHQVMRLVCAAEIGSGGFKTLAEWCGQRMIETKATKIIFRGEVVEGGEIDPFFWKMTGKPGCYLDGFDGSIKANFGEQDGGRMLIIGPLFRKDQVLKLFSHVDADAVHRALTIKGEWMETRDEPSKEAEQIESPTSKRGRSLSKHWPLFVAELALWIEEANDDPAFLTPAKLIAKLNNRLAEKGIEEMPPSTADNVIKEVLAALRQTG